MFFSRLLMTLGIFLRLLPQAMLLRLMLVVLARVLLSSRKCVDMLSVGCALCFCCGYVDRLERDMAQFELAIGSWLNNYNSLSIETAANRVRESLSSRESSVGVDCILPYLHTSRYSI